MAADNGDNPDGSAFDHDHVAPAAAANDEPSARQDVIAGMMWADYMAIHHEREDEEELGSSDEGSGSGSDDKAGDNAE